MAQSLRHACETRLKTLQAIRTDYEAEWKEIARFAQPARSRFLNAETNRNRRLRNGSLRDEHGIVAFRTLANGMTSGLSSSSRPWFTLALGDAALMDAEGVKPWLSEVERRLYAFLAQTNFYGAAKTGYAENGLFGTEAVALIEHPDAGMVCHALTAGEYWIAVSDALVPDTLYRRAPMTVRQAVDSFGKAVSSRVRTAYDGSRHDEMVDIFHAIEPDPDHDGRNPASKPWRSVYWDERASGEELLRVSGYREKPFWAARWDTTGADVYGYSPGMEALPALRELQLQVKRRNEAIDLLVHPEKVVPPGLKLTGQPRNLVSAAGVDKDAILVPYQLPYQAVAAIGDEVAKCKAQIDAASFADLFNAITNMAGIQPRTVEEIAARNEEKLTQLGPTIERVSTEKLSALIDRAFGIMERGDLLPRAPEVLEGRELQVEFVSILAQMQRMVGIGQIERTTSFVGSLAAMAPDAVDKLDIDELVDEYAARAGAPARIIRPAEAVAAMREGRAQAAQAQQMAAMAPAMKQGADAMKVLGEMGVE